MNLKEYVLPGFCLTQNCACVVVFCPAPPPTPHWSTSCSGLHFNGGVASSSTQRHCVCFYIHCLHYIITITSITHHNSLFCYCDYDLRLPYLNGLIPVISWCVRNDFTFAHRVFWVWVRVCCCWVYMKQSHRPALPFPLPLMTTHPYELHNQARPRSYWKLSLKQITWQRMGVREGSKL